MKIRTDFVTNSSSSSFIAIIRTDRNKDKSGLVEETIESIYNYGHDLKIENELMSFLCDEFYLDNELQILVNDESRIEYQKYKQYIQDGFDIFYLPQISDSGDLYYDLCNLCNLNSEEINVKNIGDC